VVHNLGASHLKVLRLKALGGAGFEKVWQEDVYTTIIAVARKIPENLELEDQKLLIGYDQTLTQTGGE
jgi:hypothetical protein